MCLGEKILMDGLFAILLGLWVNRDLYRMTQALVQDQIRVLSDGQDEC